VHHLGGLDRAGLDRLNRPPVRAPGDAARLQELASFTGQAHDALPIPGSVTHQFPALQEALPHQGPHIVSQSFVVAAVGGLCQIAFEHDPKRRSRDERRALRVAEMVGPASGPDCLPLRTGGQAEVAGGAGGRPFPFVARVVVDPPRRFRARRFRARHLADVVRFDLSGHVTWRYPGVTLLRISCRICCGLHGE